ncbi:hypothetical protein ABPG72_018291 [Tetrahymena utriculariae]
MFFIKYTTQETIYSQQLNIFYLQLKILSINQLKIFISIYYCYQILIIFQLFQQNQSMSNNLSPSKQPSKSAPLQITKKDEMKQIFKNQVDSLKIIRQTLGEVQQLNKVSQLKYKQVKENYELQLPNFKKIRKDLDVIHRSIVKVLVIEERISQIKQVREEQSKIEKQTQQQNIQVEDNLQKNKQHTEEQNSNQTGQEQIDNMLQSNEQNQVINQNQLYQIQNNDQGQQISSQNEDKNKAQAEIIENQLKESSQNENQQDLPTHQNDMQQIQDEIQKDENKQENISQ